jgi:hypothetical protein
MESPSCPNVDSPIILFIGCDGSSFASSIGCDSSDEFPRRLQLDTKYYTASPLFYHFDDVAAAISHFPDDVDVDAVILSLSDHCFHLSALESVKTVTEKWTPSIQVYIHLSPHPHALSSDGGRGSSACRVEFTHSSMVHRRVIRVDRTLPSCSMFSLFLVRILAGDDDGIGRVQGIVGRATRDSSVAQQFVDRR